MAQVVVWGHRAPLGARREAVGRAVHAAIMEALDYPPEKCFQRFVLLDDDDFVHPADRGSDYLIIEISIFEGRSERARRELIKQLFDRLADETGIAPHSVEITITETPRVNWGIRGQNAADLQLNYDVEV